MAETFGITPLTTTGPFSFYGGGLGTTGVFTTEGLYSTTEVLLRRPF